MDTPARTRQTLLDRLHQHGVELRALGVVRLGLFGSFRHERQTPESDVDFLVEFAPGRKSFQSYMDLSQLLETLAGRPVELLTRESLSPQSARTFSTRWSMSQSELEYLRHIQDEAAYLAGVGRDTEKSRFVKDETLKRASARSIEIIGEATKQLSDDLRERHSEVPWQQMARMRDRLIHGYFSVDYDIVWDVIENEAPPLQEQDRARH